MIQIFNLTVDYVLYDPNKIIIQKKYPIKLY